MTAGMPTGTSGRQLLAVVSWSCAKVPMLIACSVYGRNL
jgi:hypothetical protein